MGVAGLADHSGPDGRRLGRAAIVLGLIASVVGFFLEATHAFVQPTMVAAAPTVMNTPPGGPLLVGVFGGDLLILVGRVTLAVSARPCVER